MFNTQLTYTTMFGTITLGKLFVVITYRCTITLTVNYTIKTSPL